MNEPDGLREDEHPLGWPTPDSLVNQRDTGLSDVYLARPLFTSSDTFIAHEQGLCRYDQGQCDYTDLHRLLDRHKASGRLPWDADKPL